MTHSFETGTITYMENGSNATGNTDATGALFAGKAKRVAARLAREISPEDGWDEAARQYALERLLAFPPTSHTVVVSTPQDAPTHLGERAAMVWDTISAQAATTVIDLTSEELGMSGTINTDQPHAVIFHIDR